MGKTVTDSVCACRCVCVCGWMFLDVSVTGEKQVLAHEAAQAPLCSSCGGRMQEVSVPRVPDNHQPRLSLCVLRRWFSTAWRTESVT